MWIIPLVLSLFITAKAQAQELVIAQTPAPRLEWSYQTAPSSCTTPTPSAIVQTRANQTSTTYTVVATVPIPTPPPALATFPLPATPNNLYYSVRNACGTTNEVQYVAVVTPSPSPTLDQRVTTVETGLAALRLAVQDISAANMNQDTLLIETIRRIEALEAMDASVLSALSQAGDRISSTESLLATQDADIDRLGTWNSEQNTTIGSLQTTLNALLSRVAVLEAGQQPPAPSSNLSTVNVGIDQVDLVGLNCASLRVTGSGLRRTVTCIH